jgi:hypothetical protein
LLRDFPQRKHARKIFYHVQEDTIVNDVARIMARIYAIIENRQAYHQVFVVELEGIICKKPISILIDLGSNLSYYSPQIFEARALQRKNDVKSCLVQLAMGTKRKVIEVIEVYPFDMSGLQTQATLNILPLGSYDVLIGMEWLVIHKEILNCYDKTLECEDE